MSQAFYLLSGIPNSGKSTYATRLRWCICASEDHPQIFTQGHDAETTIQMWQHLDQGWTVIYDAANLSEFIRTYNCAIAKDIAPNCPRICIYFLTPVEICIARNQLRDDPISEKRIIEQGHYQTIPTIKEGWTKIWRAPPALEQDCSIDQRIILPESHTLRPPHQNQS